MSRRDTIAALLAAHYPREYVDGSAGCLCGFETIGTEKSYATHVADVIDRAFDQGEPRQDQGGDREALARVLYDDAGHHAADHWGVESGITRGRYESAADAVLAWMRAEGFRRHPEKPRGRGSFWTPAEWADWSDSLAELLPEEYDGDAAQEALIERALADLVGRAGEEPEGTTVTEWRIGNPDGPTFAIDPGHPEAEKWTRKTAALRDDAWVESRTVTTYRDRVTDWTEVSDD